MLAFLIPSPINGLGEAGIIAGRGREGAGEADRLIDIAGDAAPNEDLLLWLIVLGGFIGKASEVGVPGHEGIGDPEPAFRASADMADICDRNPISGGAGLLEDILRPGKSIFMLFPIFLGISSRLSRT